MVIFPTCETRNVLIRNFLRANKDIVFIRADKGSITVIIDRSDYINQMELGTALRNDNTYTRLFFNPIKNRKNSQQSSQRLAIERLYIDSRINTIVLDRVTGIFPERMVFRRYIKPDIHLELLFPRSAVLSTAFLIFYTTLSVSVFHGPEVILKTVSI